MRGLRRRLFAALDVARGSSLEATAAHADARLHRLDEADSLRTSDVDALRDAIARLEQRLDRLDRRAPTSDDSADHGVDVYGLDGSLRHVLHRVERLESGEDRPASRRLTFLTSVSPVDLDRQERAIASWLRHGDVVSLNGAEERAGIRSSLRARATSPLNDVDFVEVEETAVAEVGRPFVYIDSFLDYIDDHAGDDRAFVIINSDIVVRFDDLIDDGQLGEQLVDLLDIGPIFGSRVEVHEEGLEPVDSERFLTDGTYYWGFDFFIVTGEHVAELGRHRFIFGQPWWDYYLPHHLLSQGAVVYLENPVALHVEHAARWNTASFERLARRFEAYCVAIGHERHDDLDAQEICHEIRRGSTRVRLPRPSTARRSTT